MDSSLDIQRFPPEVLEGIFSLLAPKDLISLSQTCVIFNKTINQSDQLWATVCYNKFKIRVPRENGYARRFYKNVLHQYGHLLGFWKEAVDFNGNLLLIKYNEGQLHGLALEASHLSHDPLDHLIASTPLFKISMDEEHDHCIAIKCSSRCCIYEDPLLQSDIDLQYIYKKVPVQYSVGPKSLGAAWYLVIRTRPMCAPDRHYSRLQFSRTTVPSSAVPIQPGLFTLSTAWIPGYPDRIDIHFRSTKSLVLLTYDENWQIATGLQLTGDNNWSIVAGDVNFQADLHRCSYLDQEVRWDKDLPRQPSLIPEVYREEFRFLPSDCIARVREICVRNSPNYSSHWIVFNQDTFGFCSWRNGQSTGDWLRIYHRVKDPLLQQL